MRFEELKNKGWQNLTKEEREEYSALKAENETPKAETITMSKAELEKMIQDSVSRMTQEANRLRERNDSLEKQLAVGDWKEYKAPENKVHTAKIRKYRKDGESPWALVLGLRWFEDLFDKNDKVIDATYTVKLRHPDGKIEEIKLPLSRFATVKDYDDVTILEQTRKTLVRNHGFSKAKVVNKEGYTTEIETDVKVPLEEIMDVYTCKVQLPNGEIIELPADRLNA